MDGSRQPAGSSGFSKFSQRVIERESGEKIGLPVLYITQLLGIAMGIDHKKLGMHRLITSPKTFLRKVNPHILYSRQGAAIGKPFV
jgi:hypothetical protein